MLKYAFVLLLRIYSVTEKLEIHPQ